MAGEGEASGNEAAAASENTSYRETGRRQDGGRGARGMEGGSGDGG